MSPTKGVSKFFFFEAGQPRALEGIWDAGRERWEGMANGGLVITESGFAKSLRKALQPIREEYELLHGSIFEYDTVSRKFLNYIRERNSCQ